MNDDIWETFCDEAYYHMWCLRKIGQHQFGDGFHINDREEAIALCDLLNKMERQLAETRQCAETLSTECHRSQAEEIIVRQQRDRLAEAGQAVVDRWHTPLWKDAPHTAGFIQNLADAIVAVKGGAHE